LIKRYFARTANNGDQLLLYYPQAMAWFTGIAHEELVQGKIAGQREGYWVLYDSNGRKMTEGPFLHDRQHGHWINWRPDGTKDCEGAYQDDQMHGTWLFYEPDGTILEVEYRHGAQVRNT
jgi:antitoxin component YwqK of YwqJK toxin-antitoxin module